ncbi:MAG TPA: energy transducer TonB [Gammaproteobacteria bacterium]|jgi:protein TonB
MARAKAAVSGFPLRIEISIALHVVVIGMIYAILHFHGRGMSLPQVNNPFDHAIAVSLTPAPKPQPKPKVVPTTPSIPKPQPPAVETQATQAQDQTPPPAQKPQPEQMPQQQEQDQDQANPDYQQVAMSLLQQAKQYPRAAVLAGDEGSVNITFILNNQGTVLTYTIERSSGHEELDAEVRRLIHAVRFPPFPANIRQARMTLNVTIDFHLGGSVGP